VAVVEQGSTFEMVVEKLDNAPEYLRAIWRNLREHGLNSYDALVSFAVGSDAAAPDYVIREVIEGTVLDVQGTRELGCFGGRTHKWNRRHSLPDHETVAVTLDQLKVLLKTSVGLAEARKNARPV
jgi:hypothetical protein